MSITIINDDPMNDASGSIVNDATGQTILYTTSTSDATGTVVTNMTDAGTGQSVTVIGTQNVNDFGEVQSISTYVTQDTGSTGFPAGEGDAGIGGTTFINASDEVYADNSQLPDDTESL